MNKTILDDMFRPGTVVDTHQARVSDKMKVTAQTKDLKFLFQRAVSDGLVVV